jgi:hypothetical protein
MSSRLLAGRAAECRFLESMVEMQARDRGLRDVMLSGRPAASDEDLIGTQFKPPSPERYRQHRFRYFLTGPAGAPGMHRSPNFYYD